MDNLRQELSTVTSRLQKTMSKREVVFDIAYRELAKLRKSLKDIDDQSQYYSSTLEDVIHSAAHADKKQLDFLRKTLPSIGKEIDYAVDIVNRPTVKKMLNVVVLTLDKAGPGDVREKFGNVKRTLREDLLSSMFGDSVGGFVGDAIDRRREKKSNQKTFERNHLAERRSHLENILDNVGLEKKSDNVNKPKVGRRGSNQNPPSVENKVAPPPILDTITPIAPPKVKKTDIPAPPPIVMKNGVVTPAGDADLVEKVKPTRGRKKKIQVSDDVLNAEKSQVKEQEFREEQQKLLEDELQLLEKIEVNTRETKEKNKNVERQSSSNSGGVLSTLRNGAAEVLTKTLPTFVSKLGQSTLAMIKTGLTGPGFNKMGTFGKAARVGGNLLAGAKLFSGVSDSAKSAMDTDEVARVHNVKPADVTLGQRATSAAGTFLGNFNPLVKAAKMLGGDKISDKEINEHMTKGVGSYFNDVGRLYNESRNVGVNPLFAGLGSLGLASVKENYTPKEIVHDINSSSIGRGAMSFMDMNVNAFNNTKHAMKNIGDFVSPKQFTKNFELPKMDNLRTAYRKVQPTIDTFLGKTNPVRAVNRGIQRMLGFSDSEKQNIGLIKDELAQKGFDEKQILSVLSVAQKESQFQPREENLKGYANTKDNDYIRRVFKSIDKDGKDIPGGRLTKAKYSDAELEKLKKDTPRFTEAVYGKDTGIGKSMGNTEEGDAWKYRGRGFIQLTGKKNYKEASQAIFGDDRLVKNPDLAMEPKLAAKITAWFVKRGSQWIGKPKSNSQEDLNRFYTSVVNGSNINTSDPKSHHTKMFNEVNSNSNNPVLQEMAAIPGKKLSAAASILNTPAPVQQPPMIVDARTSVVNSGGGSSGGSAGIPNVRNEESSFKRINQNSARNN
jgi:hypothetical protein